MNIAAVPRKKLDELAAELERAAHAWHNLDILHVKSRTKYRIVGFHFRESDMALCVEYCPSADLVEVGHHPEGGAISKARVKFARSVEEMGFGSRFVFAGGTVQ